MREKARTTAFVLNQVYMHRLYKEIEIALKLKYLGIGSLREGWLTTQEGRTLFQFNVKKKF
jgi:hypothetical protein